MDTVLSISNVRFERGDKVILDSITWQVKQKEHWVVFGPNGSGKTTLLRILNGYAWPTQGEIEVLGEKFGETDLTELRKRIGWVSRSLESLIHDEDPAIEIVMAGAFAGTVLWQDVGEAGEVRARELLAQVDLASSASRSYGLLSQGEQKKVLIARALMARPGLLVLDEPCEGLDIASKERFLADLTRIASAPDAPVIIMVTHNVDEILPFYTRVLVLKEGKVFDRGSPGRIITSSLLSRLFGMRIEVEHRGGRYRIAYHDP
ncbi:MAG: ATP-binding cassette domain-containing protein [Candidatus Lokiarchaeota archaeon]|nr:ATP-binding cassette domain-containing protein [Candidatus Lokiarchaeota archaeon]